MATFQPQAKNNSTQTNQAFGDSALTWDGATFTWNQATGTWNNPYSTINQAKNVSVQTNQTKN